ncbi:MAG: hypothetical protein AAF629_30210 [Chloroflexota bacterium]
MMRESIEMKAFVSQICQKHNLKARIERTCLQLHLPRRNSLVIAKLDKRCFKVARYYDHHNTGVLLADPEIIFYVDGNGKWVPIAETSIIDGHQVYVDLGLDGQPIACTDIAAQQALATFSDTWAKMFIKQGWLNYGQEIVRAKQIPLTRFPLGDVQVTPEADAVFVRTGMSKDDLLIRHQSGDWGDLSEVDKQENDFRVNRYYKLVSAYQMDSNVSLWVTTEAYRRYTMITLPTEQGAPTNCGQQRIYQR